MKQHHIALIASERERTVPFYKTLGFSVVEEHVRPERNDRILMMSDGETVLEVFIKADAPTRPSNPEAYGLRHLAFCPNHFDALIDRLTSAGYDTEPIRFDSFTGERMTFVKDPDGLPIELHE